MVAQDVDRPLSAKGGDEQWSLPLRAERGTSKCKVLRQHRLRMRNPPMATPIDRHHSWLACRS